jgi:flagellar basal body-associated protein FliL
MQKFSIAILVAALAAGSLWFASARPHAKETTRTNSSVVLMDIDAMTRNAKQLPVTDVESFH